MTTDSRRWEPNVAYATQRLLKKRTRWLLKELTVDFVPGPSFRGLLDGVVRKDGS